MKHKLINSVIVILSTILLTGCGIVGDVLTDMAADAINNAASYNHDSKPKKVDKRRQALENY